MLRVAALLLQITVSTPDPIDLTIVQPCGSAENSSDVIVVCGRSDHRSPYRISKQPDRPSTPTAILRLGDGVTASADVEQVTVGGYQSNRAMAHLKIRF